jgi:hypothetical protein
VRSLFFVAMSAAVANRSPVCVPIAPDECPQFCGTAGFELGSGMSINTTMPEEAAAFLRDGDIR